MALYCVLEQRGYFYMGKQVKIEYRLFIELYRLIVHDDVDSEESYKRIKHELEVKFQKLVNHELYSKYKTAMTEEEQEQARQKYLDEVGIHKNFRW